MENIENIQNNIEEWVLFNLGESFEFREYQKEAIIDIIDNIINEKIEGTNGCQIIEAPTGSGKSLINIISAGVLADYYNKRSYILASDLYLWKQYYDFIKSHKYIDNKFGCLKGQNGNYKCIKTKEDLRNCECRMAGYSWAQLYNTNSATQAGYPCAKSCKYIKERKKALKSKVTLMTYALFCCVIDIQNEDDKVPVFDHRDILFCDECHNIPNIIQMQYSPSIKYEDPEHLYKLYEYAQNKSMDLFAEDDEENLLDENIKKKYGNIDDIKKEWQQIWNNITNYRINNKEDFDYIIDLTDYWEQFNKTKELVKSNITSKIKNKQKINNDDKEIYKTCLFIENYLGSIHDYLKTIYIVGKEYLVKQINADIAGNIINVEYHCAKEDFMVFQNLLIKTPYKVLLSATIGDQESYEENIGIKYYGMSLENYGNLKDISYDILKGYISDNELNINEAEIIDYESSEYKRIPSTFDFTKSPIYFINKYNMGYKDRDNSLRQLKPVLYKLLETQLSNIRGIIQTGSYQIAQEIIKDAPLNIKKRFLYYNGSREKSDVITMHELSKDTILIGPTLNEGIDLPGDKCRFILILKVPYPQLKDRLVNAKMKLFPLWYNYTTSNMIIQGIGRGNRFKDDWCITYIFDSCFFGLYTHTKEQYPKELQDRIKIL